MKFPPLIVAVVVIGLTNFSLASQPLKVATLQPLVADAIRMIGGEYVGIVELLGRDDDVHTFEPSPSTFAAIQDARLIFISGKGLESSYLHKLSDSLGPDQSIIDVGEKIPSLLFSESDGHVHHEGCNHHHAHGMLDPHWWHDAENMRRAARIIADSLTEADPANRDIYRQRSRAWRDELSALDRWIRSEIRNIPPQHRVLVTSHQAFGYFCEAYGLKPVAVQGLNHEDMPDAKTLGAIVTELRELKIPAAFSEVAVPTRMLESVADQTGVRIAGPIYPGGTGLPIDWTYEQMMRHNVKTIVSALVSAKP